MMYTTLPAQNAERPLGPGQSSGCATRGLSARVVARIAEQPMPFPYGAGRLILAERFPVFVANRKYINTIS